MIPGFVGVTDWDWFQFLKSQAGIDEVNFWQPSGNNVFRALPPGGLFLFKLHMPRNFIVGGGFFAYANLLPASLAWSAFEKKNGAQTFEEMRSRVAHYRHAELGRADPTIGCIILTQPFFLDEADWVEAPGDWSKNIVRGKGYDLSVGEGLRVFEAVQARLRQRRPAKASEDEGIWRSARFGAPQLVLPRLGQGAFRVMVTDAYGRRCAATNERTLPVLEAAHIRPYSEGGTHEVKNGILLRSDLHTLFDRGYISVRPDLTIAVSRRIRDEFENGRHYYELENQRIAEPKTPSQRPDQGKLEWHYGELFLR